MGKNRRGQEKETEKEKKLKTACTVYGCEKYKVGGFQYLASACLFWPVVGISLSLAILIDFACKGMLRKHTKT